MLEFRSIPLTRLSGAWTPRHAHRRAYAALVLDGGYEEAGEAGRWRVEPGDVLVHAPFSCHCNRLPNRTVQVLNLPLPSWRGASDCFRPHDPDVLVRLARRDAREAVEALLHAARAAAPRLAEEPDVLADGLAAGDAALQDWARAHDVSRQTAFRRFRAAYGVGPARFRVEARARRAWRMIVEGGEPLAQIALDAGFADQPHMCRDVRAFTGLTPGQWRSGRAQH